MIRNVWTILCRDIIVDQESNSISYIRCIEEGAAESVPVQIGPIFLGTLWEVIGSPPVSVGFRVVLVSPAKTSQVILQTKPIVLEGARHRLNFRINALRLEEFGMYMLRVEFNPGKKWETASALPLLIRPTGK